MIGDREHDALGAKANGLLRAVGALWGYGSREELEKAGADPLVERPDEIVETVGERFSHPASPELSRLRTRNDVPLLPTQKGDPIVTLDIVNALRDETP